MIPAPTPTQGGARLARGATAGALCTLLSVPGHLAAGGARPDLGLLVVLGLLLTGSMVVLADRRRGRLEVLAAVAGSQLALHGLLELLGSHGAHPTGAAGPGGMTLVHAVATLAAAAVLAGVEDAVFRLAGTLRRVLPRPLPPPPPLPAAPARPVTPAATGHRSGVLGARTPPRRGPPSAPSSACRP